MKKVNPDNSKTIYVLGIYEVDKTGSGTVTQTRTYYPAAGAMRIGSTLYYVLKDHLGSASVITDASGVTVSGGEQRYYPFGESRLTATMLTDKLFTGQREMTGLGIYHYQARFYSPKLGRFLSPDTIVPSAANPQEFNRYSYGLNNPIRYTDPTGHMVAQDAGGGTLENTLLYFKKYGKHKDKFNNYYAAIHEAEQALAESVSGGITEAELNLLTAFDGAVQDQYNIARDSISQDSFSQGMLSRSRMPLALRAFALGFDYVQDMPQSNRDNGLGTGITGAAAIVRALTAEDLGIQGSVYLRGTMTIENGIATVRVNMIQGSIENPLTLMSNLAETAQAEGANVLRIEGTVVNTQLYNVLTKRYGMTSTGNGNVYIEIPLTGRK